jgi:predicted SprT family Zn-dependent metalloprotease
MEKRTSRKAVGTVEIILPERSLATPEKPEPPDDPTSIVYQDLTVAYDTLNNMLFQGRLPPCLITLRKHKGAYGYFSSRRFGSKDGNQITDEIALNPVGFRQRTVAQVLATLAHEMCHLWQYHFGTPSRSGYHNREWGRVMEAIGLVPSHTGEPGGRRTGQQMTHYIVVGGPFDIARKEIEADGFDLRYVDLRDEKERARKAASKRKYRCPACGLNAWAKPDVNLVCGDCDAPMVARGEAEWIEGGKPGEMRLTEKGRAALERREQHRS